MTVGDGKLPRYEEVSPNAVQMPASIAAPESWDVADLIEHTFPELAVRAKLCVHEGDCEEHRTFFSERAMLTPKNSVVDNVNKQI